MAALISGNVVYVSATATVNAATRIHAIKYIGNTSGTAIITSVDTTNNVWQESGASNVNNNGLNIHAPSGVIVTLTNGAAVYLYLAER